MPEHDLRLLALDGGGVRGLSTLQILKQLMDTIDPESPLKPCDHFDMIGGTSTGESMSRFHLSFLPTSHFTLFCCLVIVPTTLY